jgi:hypothetical protein
VCLVKPVVFGIRGMSIDETIGFHRDCNASLASDTCRESPAFANLLPDSIRYAKLRPRFQAASCEKRAAKFLTGRSLHCWNLSLNLPRRWRCLL